VSAEKKEQLNRESINIGWKAMPPLSNLSKTSIHAPYACCPIMLSIYVEYLSGHHSSNQRILSMGGQSTARKHMIEGQIRPNDVTDKRVIAAFEAVPREGFVSGKLKGVAYIDEDIEVAPGRYMMEPRVLARLLQAADITAEDSVLDVGSATGYAAALMSMLAGSVVALEEDKSLADKAMVLLSGLKCNNITVACNKLNSGFKAQAPYDVILLGGMFEVLPKEIESQLAENGRLVGVCNSGGVGKACLFVKTAGVVGRRELFDATLRSLPGFKRETGFQF
jgi:protein-L-isoaspartate(D-aspartate) O-methyltransferase